MITDHGRISNEGLFNIDFSRTLIAQENSTSTSSTYWWNGVDAKRTSRLAVRDQVEQ
jgi:hypothetical protein